MTVVPIPAQYANSVTTSWNAYVAAVTFYGGTSLEATALGVLMVWLNKCNQALGRPTVARPYPNPPVAPAVETADGTLTGDMTGNLAYSA
jgi:hypothetical protein